MDHDDDVEHLFSWLQTPDLRYREFAGAREITDTVATSQILRNIDNGLASEAPAETKPAAQSPEYDAAQTPDLTPLALSREPSKAVPFHRPFGAPAGAPAGPPLPSEPDVFALGAGGRGATKLASPTAPASLASTEPSPSSTRPAPLAPPAPRSAPSMAPPAPRPQAAAGWVPPETRSPPPAPEPPQSHGLLGGAYRPNGTHGPAAAEEPKRAVRPLDAVFSRLAGRARPPDPHDRLRRLPGLGPPGSRSR